MEFSTDHILGQAGALVLSVIGVIALWRKMTSGERENARLRDERITKIEEALKTCNEKHEAGEKKIDELNKRYSDLREEYGALKKEVELNRADKSAGDQLVADIVAAIKGIIEKKE